jgi:ABC-type transport system substrate-binding protein
VVVSVARLPRGVVLGLVLALAACTNSPYPDADAGRKVLYTPFPEPPRTLDPAVAYTTSAHAVIGNVYDTLLEYHYLARPYTLIAGLAEAVPVARPLPGGRVLYRFALRDGLLYQDDPCFRQAGGGHATRQVVAADVAFSLARIADPAVNSPVVETFAKIVGFREFAERLQARRDGDAAFAALGAHEQYAAVGGVPGVRVRGTQGLELVLAEPYPQILYWFAMPFTAPVPWEAVAYYDGHEGREQFADHPVGAGPFYMTLYDKQSRIVLERNPNWYGTRHSEWNAPGAVYPAEGMPEDAELGRLDPAVVGRPLPFIERLEFHREKEAIPAFTKFLQGYYDMSGIIRESFDRIVREDRLSPEMAALGMQLDKTVRPAIFYLGFNMDDPVVGAPAGERGRLLRQAMSLAVDAKEFARLFLNGRGIPAQSPLPPGIFGYDPDYVNPYRRVDLERAAALLEQAGYPRGIDPATQKPLRLTFDTGDTTARGLLTYQFHVNAWGRLGLDVRIDATSYNQFQDKVRKGAYQLFQWGWVADYPDPENFLFLLQGAMGRTQSGGPNTANFADPHYDRLFLAMKTGSNDARRLAIIREMLAILERERPWIELFYPEDYVLFHGWLANVKPAGLSIPTAKYLDIDEAVRARQRADWNRPIMWPAYVLAIAALAVLLPGIVTFVREQRR